MTEKEPSYLGAMMTSQGNVYAALGAMALAALLSIPFGFGIGSIPLIVFAAGEFIAALYIPSSIKFRDDVDRRFRAEQRWTTRKRLLDEIQGRDKNRSTFEQTYSVWLRMTERVSSLYRHAADTRTRLQRVEIERLDDATIEFLCLWLAKLVMEDRADSVNLREIENRVVAIDRELVSARPGVDVRQLQRAKTEYLSLSERHNRMLSRKIAIDAALLSMPDQMEEIYQTIMTTPANEDLGAKLNESIEKLRIQEDIESELSGEIDSALLGMVSPRQRSAAINQQRARGNL